MSDNIIKSLETPEYISFKTECDCFTHDLHVSIEKDEFNFISLELRDNIYIQDITESHNPFVNFWKRIKIAWFVLIHGYYEIEYGFCFKGQEHFEDFVNYINKCKEKFSK